MGQSIESRPPQERARHYRQLAKEAIRLAEALTDKNLRVGYLAMATGWHSLAQEAERLAAAETPMPAPRGPAQPEQNGN